MKTFDWDLFKNTTYRIAVHCKTKEDAENFCRMMHEHGLRWCNGNSYLKQNNYHVYTTKTCYTNKGAYSPYDFYKQNKYIIVEYGDFFDTDYIESVEEFIERTRRTT